ncbi:MAG TPA: cation transporter, partial [Firmicutes bacterium]|nr:cation transporter [Bacillota bacterium]
MEENRTRLREGSRGAWIGIIGNLGLAAVKGAAGVIAGSTAMVADALHSLADLTGSLIVLVAFRFANQPADQCHPYGHGKAESLATTLVGLILIFTGIGVGWSSLRGIFLGSLSAPGILALYMAVVSIVIKEGMYQYKIRLGKKLSSPALIASAWEHRSDALTSIAALIGIGGARIGYPIMDPLAAAVVSLAVVRIGAGIGRDGLAQLMDRVPEQAVLVQLGELAAGVKGVEEVQKVWLRSMGSYLLVDITIAVR